DFHVTGVQTCALPIWMSPDLRVAAVIWIGYEAPNGATIVQNTVTPRAAQEGALLLRRDLAAYRAARQYSASRDAAAEAPRVYLRSEERRVGNESRNSW